MRALLPWSVLLFAGCPMDAVPEDPSETTETGWDQQSSGGEDAGEPTVATGMPEPEPTTTGGPNGTTFELTASNTGDTSTGDASSSGETSTGDTWTSEPGTSTGDTSTSTGDTSSTGEPDTSTSTGAPDTSTSTSTSTSTGETGETGDTGDTGDTGEENDTTTGGVELEPFACCDKDCTYDLVQGHGTEADVVVDGDRMITIGYDGGSQKVILWDRLTGAVLRVERGVSRYAFAGGVLQIYRGGVVGWYAAGDGAYLGAAPGTTSSGLASDGSYAWVGTATELTGYTTAGAVLWTLAGNFAASQSHGIPGALYVAKQQGNELLAIDPATGVATPIAKQGNMGGWFYESGRFWTTDGQAVRLYEPDGTQLGTISGQIYLGAHDHFVVGDHIRHVDQPGKNLQAVTVAGISRNAIWTADNVLITLEADGIHQAAMTVPESWLYSFTRFGYDAGHWGLVGVSGEHVDDLGRWYTAGKLESVSAAKVGRLAAMTKLRRTHVFDVTPDCTAGKSGEFDRPFVLPVTLADDGSVMLAQDHNVDNVQGTNFHAMPAGEVVDFLPGGEWLSRMEVSDDADTLVRDHVAYSGPQHEQWYDLSGASGYSDVAPDGLHTVFAESKHANDAGMQSYVYDADGITQVLDGIAFGFLDSEHLLLGKYKVILCPLNLPCPVYEKSQVVTLDGNVVMDNIPGPEAPLFERISPNEMFVANKPDALPEAPRVYDAYTGALLWEGPKRLHHAALGADYVVISDGGDLVVHRWR